MRDLGPGQIRRQIPEYAQLASANSSVGEGAPPRRPAPARLAARRRCPPEERHERFRDAVAHRAAPGSGHRKGEDQPIWLGGRERGLGPGRGGVRLPRSRCAMPASRCASTSANGEPVAGRVRNVSVHPTPHGVSLRHTDRCTRVAKETHPTEFSGESGQRLARLGRHPEPSLSGGEPSDDGGRESVHTCESRLHLRARSERFERRLTLPASSVQLACHQAQQHRGGRVDFWLGDLPGAAQGALACVELSRPYRPKRNRAMRGREYRPIAQAIAFGQRRPPDAPVRARSQATRQLSGKSGERDTRPRGRAGRWRGRAWRPRKGAARHRRIAGPRLHDPEIHQRDPPQLSGPGGAQICLRSTHQARSPAPVTSAN